MVRGDALCMKPGPVMRGLLVASSCVNGARNVFNSYNGGQNVGAAADRVLTVTSVLWWKDASSQVFLTCDKVAVIWAFTTHAYHIQRCQDAHAVLMWLVPGAALVVASYIIGYVGRCTLLSHCIWILFHIVQTNQNVEYLSSSCNLATRGQ